MGWFAKIKKEKSDMEKATLPDKTNPFTRGIEDEGELVTIVHTRNIVPLEEEENEEEIEEDGSTVNRQYLSQ